MQWKYRRPDGATIGGPVSVIYQGAAIPSISSVHGYREQCALFLQRQIEIIRLSVVVAPGVKAESYVSKLDHPWMKSRHPTDWHFRERITREKRLKAQGELIVEFLIS